MVTPVRAYGAHRRLQQSPHSLQTTPSTPEQKVEPSGGRLHVPTSSSSPLLHWPVQQSSLRMQASPGWMQNEAPSVHLLSAPHSCEQQSPLSVQSLPAVEQSGFSASQVPSTHWPPQHSSLEAHSWPSEMQASSEHSPPSQRSVQQSVAPAQGSPAG